MVAGGFFMTCFNLGLGACTMLSSTFWVICSSLLLLILYPFPGFVHFSILPFWSCVFSFPPLGRLFHPCRSLVLLYSRLGVFLCIALGLFELLLQGGDVIGGAFGIGSGWINVPEPPAFAVGDEVGAVFSASAAG
jgi:hypothetical protein